LSKDKDNLVKTRKLSQVKANLLQFHKKNILLGDSNGTKLIEHVKLIFKQHVYQSKLNDEEPNYIKALSNIKYKAKI
jgi:hypothetical protein